MSSFPESEKKRLERKAKAGWAAFFAMRTKADDLAAWVKDLKIRNRDLYRATLAGEDVDLKFLKTQYLEMYEKLKMETECPICFETINKENAKLTNCGHLHCLTCFNKLDNCSICRKKIWKPKPQQVFVGWRGGNDNIPFVGEGGAGV